MINSKTKSAGLVFTALFALLLCAGKTVQAGDSIPWAKSYAQAAAKAKASQKLILVDFYTDWCVACKQMDRETYPNARVAQALRDYVPVRVNAEKGGSLLAQKYNVTAYPTLLFLNERGEVQFRMRGGMPAQPFVAALNQINTIRRDLPALEAQFAARPDDVRLAARLVNLYAFKESPKIENAFSRVQKLDPADAKGLLSKSANALGDMYSGQDLFVQAAQAYLKAAKRGKTPYEIGYGYINAAVSYAKANDAKNTVGTLKAAIADPKSPAQAKKEARAILARLQNYTKQG